MDEALGLPRYGTILSATDGSDYSRVASRHAVYLAKATGARVVGVYVVNTHAAVRLGIYYGEAVREMEEEGRRALDDMGRLAVAAGVDFTPLLASGNPKVTIVGVAREQAADLVVLGAHGQSRLERALIGSVSEFVVRHAGCTVLVVRGGAGDGPGGAGDGPGGAGVS